MYSDRGLFVASDEMKTLWSQAESIFMNYIYYMSIMYFLQRII